MSRASNHANNCRQAAHATRLGGPDLHNEGRRQLWLLAASHAVERAQEEHREHYEQACRVWCGGEQPVAARAPWWADGALGQELVASPYLDIAREAPCLLTADIPPASMVVAEPAHWHVAADVLIRAVVFDGLKPDHPSVRALADVLAPVAQAELRHAPSVRAWLLSQERKTGHLVPRPPVLDAFPVLDAPVTILSLSVLAAADAATVGGKPGEEINVLSRALGNVIPGVAGSVMAGVLSQCANPLEVLAEGGAVQPSEALGAGLSILAALLRLITTDAASTTRRTA
jgi:hypothetical protein